MRERSILSGAAQANALPRPNFTAAAAFATGEALRSTLHPADVQAFDAATDLARRHPLIDVLDAYCDGIERIERTPVDERRSLVAQLLDDVHFAARYWPEAAP